MRVDVAHGGAAAGVIGAALLAAQEHALANTHTHTAIEGAL